MTFQLRAVIIGVLVSASAWAAEPPPAPAAPSQQQRATMAAAHEKMAACLRSDKSIDVCRTEMHKACMSMGESHCSMMGAKETMAMHNGMHPAETKQPHHEPSHAP